MAIRPQATFKPSKVTPGQLPLLAKMLVYFNGERLSAQRRAKVQAKYSSEQYIHPISITKIYGNLRVIPKNRPVVHFAANVFFERKFRGHGAFKGKQARCSGWALRPYPKVNDQLIRLIHELFELNAPHMTELRSVIKTKRKLDENGNPTKVEVEFTTTFELPTQHGTDLIAVLQTLEDVKTVEQEAA